jgi:hypothetical protein
MTKLRALAILLVLAAVLSWPCRKQTGVRGIDLAVVFSNRILTDNLFTEVTYRFRMTPSFAPLTEDHHVVAELVVHGRPVFRDEFEPPIPTSKWEGGRQYAFTRRIYIPAFIDEFSPAFKGTETAGLSVGLALASGKAAGSRLVVYDRKLQFTPSPDSPLIVYLTGWYPPETNTSEPGTSWRWTGKDARVAIDNPGRDAVLIVRGRGDPAAPPGQKVTIGIDGRVLEEFRPESAEFEKRYLISKEWLGGRKDFVLVIAVDKTFVPAKTTPGSEDQRELGVPISLIYFR